jgi:hypothetical protein
LNFFEVSRKKLLGLQIAKMYGKRVCSISCMCPIKIATPNISQTYILQCSTSRFDQMMFLGSKLTIIWAKLALTCPCFLYYILCEYVTCTLHLHKVIFVVVEFEKNINARVLYDLYNIRCGIEYHTFMYISELYSY